MFCKFGTLDALHSIKVAFIGPVIWSVIHNFFDGLRPGLARRSNYLIKVAISCQCIVSGIQEMLGKAD